MAKNKGGRPLKFTLKELETQINQYFLDMVKEERPFTITGLAVALETDRITLLEYGKRDEFTNTIKKAKQKIHNYAEESLWKSGIATGMIFNLKNNWAWKDKMDVSTTNETNVNISSEERKSVIDLIDNL